MPDELLTNIRRYLNRISTGSGPIPDRPNSNIEFYLNKIAIGTGETPKPGTNIEYYLYHIANKSGDIPEPHTDLEKFLYHIATENGDVPEPHTEVEVLLKQIIDGGGGGGDLDPTTFGGIQKIVKAGKAQEFFAINDVINIAKYTSPKDNQTYDLPLKVVSFKNATLQNGESVPAMTVMTDVILDVQLPLSNSLTYAGIKKSDSSPVTGTTGFERWEWDVQRQWLNSEGKNWFHNYWDDAIKAGDLSADSLKWSDTYSITSLSSEEPTSEAWYNYPGFLSCISNDLASVLTPTKVDTVFFDKDRNETDTTTYDKVTIMSAEQMYMVPFYTGADMNDDTTVGRENGYLEWFKQEWLKLGKTGLRGWGGSACTLDAQLSPMIGSPTYMYGVTWTRTATAAPDNHVDTGGWANSRANRNPKTKWYIRPLITIC